MGSVLQQKELHANAHATAASNGYKYPLLPYANLVAYPNVQVKEQEQPEQTYAHHQEQPELQHYTSGFVAHLNGAVVPQDAFSVLQQKQLHATAHANAAFNGYKYPLLPYANLAAYPNVQVKEEEQPHSYYYYEQPEPQHHTSGFVKHL